MYYWSKDVIDVLITLFILYETAILWPTGERFVGGAGSVFTRINTEFAWGQFWNAKVILVGCVSDCGTETITSHTLIIPGTVSAVGVKKWSYFELLPKRSEGPIQNDISGKIYTQVMYTCQNPGNCKKQRLVAWFAFNKMIITIDDLTIVYMQNLAMSQDLVKQK